MSLASSLIALVLGVPIGIFLSARKTGFGAALTIINRTLMGMPPVVCGLLCYLMFCGVGPLRWAQLLYTIPGMVNLPRFR